MVENALVERTYQALMGVVQTTAVSRKVLMRPPFTFLHKLLVETLGEYDIFSEQQLQFSAMVTKQAKAAFLTRAIAFVSFAMNAKPNRQHISCLLLVSPVQVLAGVSVHDTLEFLLQLCEVCRMTNRDIKEAAAREVREKGDAHLYSSGVTFRKGLVLIQGIIRSFLKRRVRKAPRLNTTPTHGKELSMTEGTRFLKELADGRVYNGIIRSVQKNIYVLGYEEEAEAQDKVNSGEALLVPKTSKLNMLKRSHTQTQFNTEMGLFSVPSSDSILSTKSSSRGSFTDEAKVNPSGNQAELRELRRQTSKTNDWQNSLKKILAEDTQDRSTAHVPSLPKLGIPGTKPLAPLIKRGSNGSNPSTETKSIPKDQVRSSPSQASVAPQAARASLQRGNSSSNLQRSVAAPVNASVLSPSPSVPEGVVDSAFAGTYQTTDQRTQEKQALIRDIVMRIDSYMKRKRLRVIDLFRFCDADGNGSISPEEMIETLSQMEIQLTPDQARAFLQHIDKDGNGSIDVDEFEELVRVSRRNEAQREQLKKELNGSRKQSDNKTSQRHNGVVKAKAKQAILDEFKAVQEQDGDGMTANQLRSLIARLSLPGINDAFINSLVDRVVEIAGASTAISPPTSSQSQTRSSNKSTISYHHLTKALDELEWTKKSNRFLDPSWIRQFDSQLERAIREYELL
ncbi:calcium-binding protein CML8 [Phytophthora nicotianae]|uniref:Calcium-binding protein CML8 n=1 Tax=Phytophthora nicotianae TaxID=4792 RepID=A0A0W8BVR3_PHYNI|nr:calcium-binding protein CML8 [Phytophthora nicotianae]